MPSANLPPRRSMPVPVPGTVPMPPIEESPDNRKKLIAMAVALALLLLLLLLLLFFLGKKPPANGGGGQGAAGIGAGAGEQSGVGDSGGAGAGIGGQAGRSNEDTASGNGNADQSGAAIEPDENAEESQPESPTDDDIMIPGTSVESESIEPQGAELREDLSTTDLVAMKVILDEQQVAGPTHSPPAPTSSGSGGGGGVTVRVFGVGGHGNKFMYVFDRSGSMSGQKLEEVKKELLRSFSVLNNRHQFNIIFYDNRYDAWKPRLTAATPQVKREAEQFVRGISAGGGTEHLAPLLEAIKHKPDVIFFLTDGQSLTQAQLDEICQKSGDICINVIQYDDGRDGRSEILRQLALRNRGRYRYINVATADAL